MQYDLGIFTKTKCIHCQMSIFIRIYKNHQFRNHNKTEVTEYPVNQSTPIAQTNIGGSSDGKKICTVSYDGSLGDVCTGVSVGSDHKI